ncbi:MAG: hypothetical protein R3E09_18010 [Novosphingobium sp.]
MTIDKQARIIQINYLEGRIQGTEPVEAPSDHKLSWRWGLIVYDRMRSRRTRAGGLIVTLSDTRHELSFQCFER